MNKGWHRWLLGTRRLTRRWTVIEVDTVFLTRSYVVCSCHPMKPQFNLCKSFDATIFISIMLKDCFR